jgi:hypothetical protein
MYDYIFVYIVLPLIIKIIIIYWAKLKKKKGYILSRDSEVTLSHWSLSIELVIMPLIDL